MIGHRYSFLVRKKAFTENGKEWMQGLVSSHEHGMTCIPCYNFYPRSLLDRRDRGSLTLRNWRLTLRRTPTARKRSRLTSLEQFGSLTCKKSSHHSTKQLGKQGKHLLKQMRWRRSGQARERPGTQKCVVDRFARGCLDCVQAKKLKSRFVGLLLKLFSWRQRTAKSI